jgi:hypothetical protein
LRNRNTSNWNFGDCTWQGAKGPVKVLKVIESQFSPC